MKRLLALAAVFALGLAGCGEVIDSAKTEDTLKAELEKGTGLKITTVDCPSDVDVKAGETFECTIEIKGGGEKTAKLEVTDKDADLQLLNPSDFEQTAP